MLTKPKKKSPAKKLAAIRPRPKTQDPWRRPKPVIGKAALGSLVFYTSPTSFKYVTPTRTIGYPAATVFMAIVTRHDRGSGRVSLQILVPDTSTLHVTARVLSVHLETIRHERSVPHTTERAGSAAASGRWSYVEDHALL